MDFAKRISCSGFGGQGVMMLGQLLAYSGLIEGKEVTWVPAYGPEMRGGTANCSVVISDEEIANPITETGADVVVVMNKPSFDKFLPTVRPGGKIFINSNLVDDKVEREDISAYYVPVSDIAEELGNSRLINIVMLGAVIEADRTVKIDALKSALGKIFTGAKSKLIPLNEKAIEEGAKCVGALVL